MKKHIYVIIYIILSFTLLGQKKDSLSNVNKLFLGSKIIFENSKLNEDSVKISVFEDSVLISQTYTDKTGIFKLEFNFNHLYNLEISKPGYYSKSFTINTYNVVRTKKPISNRMYIESISLIKDNGILNSNDLLKSLVEVYFNKETNGFDYNQTNANQKLSDLKSFYETIKLINENPSLKKQFEDYNQKIFESESKAKEETFQKSKKEQEIITKELEIKNASLLNEKQANELSLAKKEKELQQALILEKENVLFRQELEGIKKTKQIALLNEAKVINELNLSKKDLEIKNQVSENQKKEQEIKLIEQARKLQSIEVEQQKKIRNIFIGGISILIIGLIFIVRGYLEKQKNNKQLGEQNTIIQNQKVLVEEKQREVYESISYAKRLQVAILPPLNLIKNHLPDSFVLYKPKDIVAGDFYWFETKNDILLIAAADCTGHGVPGAMVSVVCSNALNRTVNEFKLTKPGEILDKVRELVLETFSKSETEVKDGMDISLCSINKTTNEICWSGANNPLWYIQNSVSSSGVENKELIEIKADKQPIGKYALEKPFTTHSIKLNKKDSLYLFTDGYADQFGGPKGKKFKYKQLQELLISIQHEEPNNQEIILNQKFEEWKKDTEQVDDVCIIGITF